MDQVHVVINDYIFDGNERPDGSLAFRCIELPGFRLIVRDPANARQKVEKAFNVFYPIFLEAQQHAS